MTQNEHRLMVYMFTRQMVIIRSLMEIMKRSGVMEDGDYEAFETLVWEHEKTERTNITVVSELYTSYAKELGPADQLPH